MFSDVVIRPATLKDLSDISRLIEIGTKGGKILKRSRTDLRRGIHRFFVAEKGGRTVACCALEIYSKKLSEVRSLAVEKESQQKGIASALLERCVREAKKRRVYEVLAITDRQNLFKRRGFSEQLHGQKALFLRP